MTEVLLNLVVLAQVPDYIDLAEGVGYGSRLSSILAFLGGLIVFGLVVGVVYFGVHWFRSNLTKSSSAPVRILPRETRLKVRGALSTGDYLSAGEILVNAGENHEAAESFMMGGAYDRAAQIFEEMGVLARAIQCHKRAGRYDEAGRIYSKMGRPHDAGAEYFRAKQWGRAGDMYAEAGDFRRAGENYERAERLLEAAEAFDEADQPLKAAELYARHLKARVDSGDGDLSEIPQGERERARRAGELFRDAGETTRASEIFLAAGFPQEAAETLRISGDYTRAAQLLLEADQPKLAAKFLEEAGDAQEAARTRAEAALEAGELDEAAREFHRAGEMERAAQLFEEAKKPEKAAELYEELEQFKKAMELYLAVPRYAHAARCAEFALMWTRAAEYYREAGDIEGELRALKEEGDFFRAGRLEFEHRMYDEALKTLERIDSRDANYVRSLELQGDIFRSQKRAEKAYSKYRAAMGNRDPEPGTLPLLYKMGLALEDEPDLGGALDCYSKVVEVDEHFEDAQLRMKAIQKRMRRGTLTGRRTTGLFSAVEGEEEPAQRYEILEEVARGGMGIVYKARDTVLGRTVAFKILGENLRDNETAVKYFLREARAAAALSHPNIVTIYDAGEQDGEYYMAMEFVEGTTLKELIRRTGALPDDKVRYILKNCCRALDYAHSKGIIHRDIKSGNVMTTRDRALKVMDFGLAKFLKEYQNNHTQQVGTPFYMSPEQIIGEDIDFRSDLYGLGCTVFECATGTVPFFKGDLSYHHIHTKPPEPRSINPGLSQELEEIILKLLEKDPANRFQSAAEILKRLGE